MKNRCYIGLQRFVEHGRIKVFQRCSVLHTRVVNKTVDSAVLAFESIHCGGTIIVTGNIEG